MIERTPERPGYVGDGIEILHFPNFDIILNRTVGGDTKRVEELLEQVKDGLPENWKLDPKAHPGAYMRSEEVNLKDDNYSSPPCNFIFVDSLRDPKYLAKKKNLFNAGLIRRMRSDPDAFSKGLGRRFPKRTVYAFNSLLNEIRLSQIIADLLASEEAEAIVRKLGFSQIRLAEPLLGLIDKKREEKIMFYDYIEDYSFVLWSPHNMVESLRRFFKTNDIEPSDLESKQFIISAENRRIIYLIDIEGFTFCGSHAKYHDAIERRILNPRQYFWEKTGREELVDMALEARLTECNRQERRGMPVILSPEVDNVVIKVNPNFEMPFDLRKGQRTPLGLFARSVLDKGEERLNIIDDLGKEITYTVFDPSRNSWEGKPLEPWPGDERSAILGRIICIDRGGNIYRDIVLNGIGDIYNPHSWRSGGENLIVSRPGLYPLGVWRPRFGSGKTVWGLLDLDEALKEYQLGELLTQSGIRTSRILAIIELKELILNGERISIKEARKKGLFGNDFRPVIEVQAFGTKARISDFIYPHGIWTSEEHEEWARLQLEGAKRLVAQEFGFKEPMSDVEYLKWLAKTLGLNLALMHKKGWCCEGGITMDGRIGDLTMVGSLGEHEGIRWNYFSSVEGKFCELAKLLAGEKISQQLVRLLQKSYDEVFPPEDRRRFFHI